MPRELRMTIQVVVQLPENPSSLAAVIMGCDRAVDDLRAATGGVVEAESEIVISRKKETMREAADSQTGVTELIIGDGAVPPISTAQSPVIFVLPRVEVPPMDPAPVVGPQPVVHHKIANAADDNLDIPQFLVRT